MESNKTKNTNRYSKLRTMGNIRKAIENHRLFLTNGDQMVTKMRVLMLKIAWDIIFFLDRLKRVVVCLPLCKLNSPHPILEKL